MLTDLLQNECRRRKLLGVTGACSLEIFSILTTLSALSWLFESVIQYLPVPFSLDEAFQICKLFRQSQCPCSCCNECTARQLLSILACAAGARKGKGEGKIGRATRRATTTPVPSPLPASRRAPDFDFPFLFPFLAPATQAMSISSVTSYRAS